LPNNKTRKENIGNLSFRSYRLNNIHVPAHTHIETSKTGFQGEPHQHHEHFKVHRLNDGLPTDKSHYLGAIIAELHAGEPVPGNFVGPVVVYVIEGELHVVDNSKPDEVAKLVAGDVIHYEAGTTNLSSSPSKCKVLGVTYVPSHLHPDDQVVEKH